MQKILRAILASLRLWPRKKRRSFANAADRHDFLFELYDYADYLADHAPTSGSNMSVNFLMLVYIEKFFDIYGRSAISAAAREANSKKLDPNKSLAEAHRRIDLLRKRMWQLVDENDFSDVMDNAGPTLSRRWRKP